MYSERAARKVGGAQGKPKERLRILQIADYLRAEALRAHALADVVADPDVLFDEEKELLSRWTNVETLRQIVPSA